MSAPLIVNRTHTASHLAVGSDSVRAEKSEGGKLVCAVGSRRCRMAVTGEETEQGTRASISYYSSSFFCKEQLLKYFCWIVGIVI